MSLKGLGTAEKAFTVPRTPQTRKFKHEVTNEQNSQFQICSHMYSHSVCGNFNAFPVFVPENVRWRIALDLQMNDYVTLLFFTTLCGRTLPSDV